MIEEWKSIPEYEGFYSISSIGRVRRDCRGPGTFPGKILKNNYSKDTGYYYVTLSKNDRARNYRIHQLVARAFYGLYTKDKNINHIDGNKINNLPNNLEIISPGENIKHAWRIGLINLNGELSPNSKLSNEAIKEIRSTTGKQLYLANKYGVHRNTIQKVRARTTWKHL